MKKALSSVVLATALVLGGSAAAFAQTTDPVAETIGDLQTQFTGYAVPLLTAVAAIVGVFIAIPLVKKFARMVRNAIG